ALGKFSTLLEATAKSPAMLFYLDNFQSVSPNANRPNAGRPRQGLGAILRGGAILRPKQPQTNPAPQRPAAQSRRGINENYARELMELHTLGVDGGYTQK